MKDPFHCWWLTHVFIAIAQFRPVARGGSRGFGRTPPCSLAKFIFNENSTGTGYNHSTVQCYYRRHASHHAAATRGSHIHVACRSVCDRDQEFWSVKILIAWSLRSEALDRLFIPRKRCNYDVHRPHPSWIINLQNFSAALRAAFYFRTPLQESLATGLQLSPESCQILLCAYGSVKL